MNKNMLTENGSDNIRDAILAKKARANDARAERELFDSFRHRIEAHLARSSADIPGAEQQDLIQEGLIGLLQAVNDYDPEKNPNFTAFAWLCIDRQIQNAREKLFRQKNQPLNSYVSIDESVGDSSLTLGEELGEEGSDPEKVLLQSEEVKLWMERVEEKLTPLERQVLYLYLDGYKGRIIAMILDRDPKSVDNALQRLRKKMKEFKGKP
ncbi:MAG: sigma-70 family RNA polymerase sigma factor [Lachnospiraceae bacterium]|nr:sigma-70 family RNA polymerase sigma factor [Lachnospiraceae bacterium]